MVSRCRFASFLVFAVPRTALPSCQGVPQLSELLRAWYDPYMASSPEIAAFDRGVRPVLQMVFPEKAEAVLKFKPDPALQARIDELATKCTEGQLTEAERAEYEGYVRANK